MANISNNTYTSNNQNNNTTSPVPQPQNSYSNQFDAGQYYQIGESNNCQFQDCVLDAVDQDRFYFPTIADIAAYNLSTIYGPGNTQNMNMPRPRTNSPTNQPIGNASLSDAGVPDTPATVLDYGATIDSNLQQNMMLANADGITDIRNPFPVTPESLQYLNGFIRTQIGRRVTIDFLVGSNNMVSKSGYLLGVATNYILINELDTTDITTCDFYNIKFIRFYY